MAKIKATSWQPKITEPGEAVPRRRNIIWAMLSKHGSSPNNCRNCAGDGGARSESCRLRFEKVLDTEEARSDSLWLVTWGVLLEESARLWAMPAHRHANPQRGAPETTAAAAPATQSSAPDAVMDIAEPAAET